MMRAFAVEDELIEEAISVPSESVSVADLPGH